MPRATAYITRAQYRIMQVLWQQAHPDATMGSVALLMGYSGSSRQAGLTLNKTLSRRGIPLARAERWVRYAAAEGALLVMGAASPGVDDQLQALRQGASQP